MFHIVDNYYIQKVSQYQWCIKRKDTIKRIDAKNYGKEVIRSLHYCPSLEKAFIKLREMLIADGNMKKKQNQEATLNKLLEQLDNSTRVIINLAKRIENNEQC